MTSQQPHHREGLVCPEGSSLLVQTAAPLVILLPAGELRRDSTDTLLQAVDKLLPMASCSVICVSMRCVSALLSEGIRTLVAVRDKCINAGKAFHITDLPTEVKYTLEITNLLPFLNHVESTDAVMTQYKISSADLREWQSSVVAGEERPAVAAGKRRFGSSSRTGAEESVDPLSLDLMNEADLKRLVQQCLPGRIAVGMVERLMQNGAERADGLAEYLGQKDTAVEAMAETLIERGVIRRDGERLAYGARDEWDRAIRAFLDQWRNPSKKPRLMAMLLAAER